MTVLPNPRGPGARRRFATRSLQTVFSLALFCFLQVTDGCTGEEGQPDKSFPPPKAFDSPLLHLAQVCSEPNSMGFSPEL